MPPGWRSGTCAAGGRGCSRDHWRLAARCRFRCRWQRCAGSLASITGGPLRRSRAINGAAPALLAHRGTRPRRSRADGSRSPPSICSARSRSIEGHRCVTRSYVLVTRGGAADRPSTAANRWTQHRGRAGCARRSSMPSDHRSSPSRPVPLRPTCPRRLRAETVAALPVTDEPPEPRVFDVSVVIASLDRPDDLATCLGQVCGHRTRHRLEVVVVDNNPASGLTAGVLDRFPGVVHVDEPRRGLAYARNAGFLAATGEVLVATDDDVRVPDGWLDLPRRAVRAQRRDGGVRQRRPTRARDRVADRLRGIRRRSGRGTHRRSSGAPSSPTPCDPFAAWDLGATANAAFRASIFDRPDIGLMDEALGPGMPIGRRRGQLPPLPGRQRRVHRGLRADRLGVAPAPAHARGAPAADPQLLLGPCCAQPDHARARPRPTRGPAAGRVLHVRGREAIAIDRATFPIAQGGRPRPGLRGDPRSLELRPVPAARPPRRSQRR